VQYSVWPNMKYPTDEVLELARWLDDGRWQGMWFADHYMPNTGSAEIDDGPAHECWALLPAVAAITQKLRLGPLVAPTSIHHPALLANRAVTIDHLSHGRFVLGLGAGWQINEHVAYGIDLGTARERVDRFSEAIQIVRSLLDTARTTFHGEVYTITDAPCEPSPVQEHLPILVGTGGNRMLKITARHADEWNTWGHPEVAIERLGALHAACDAVGRPRTEIRTSVQVVLYLGDDERATAVMNGPLAPRAVTGSAQHLIDTLGAYAEAGFDDFIVPDWVLGRDAAERRDGLDRLWHEVLSHV